MTFKITITDEQPRFNANALGRSTSAENDMVRNLLKRLVINGQWGKVSGYADKKSAEAGAKAARRENASNKGQGWYVKAATQKENDGTFSLFIRKVSIE